MADEEQAIQRPAQAYQTPAWETPATNKRRSLFDRFVPSSATHGYRTTSDEPSSSPSRILGWRNGHDGDDHDRGCDCDPKNAFLPPRPLRRSAAPHKTYVGLSRNRFLLFVLLPLAILLLLVLPLALGLGLSNRGDGKQDLPLPTNKEVHTGDLTYYAVGLGACGQTHGDTDMIVSVSHYIWDEIRVRRDGEGSVDVTVVDRCTGCEPTDLDLSPAVFERLADKDEGRVTGTWTWLD
ncbi:SCP-like extracellular protein [Colletotrichum higginsianum]|nr:SCP-like extracellular protein [Colletotrichum higginsianum]